jgi:hypothetical protein
MKWKIRTIFIATPIILSIATVSYAYIKKHADLGVLLKQYKAGLTPIKTRENPFYPQAQLDLYDSIEALRAGSMPGELALHTFRSGALLELGKEKDAIEDLEHMLNNTGLEKTDPLYVKAQKELSLAYLRLGERNNCISNHSAGSCIFPIQGKGIYTDPTASQKAIRGYEAVLQSRPDDLEARWLLNVAYMTIGEYPDKVPPALLIPGLDKDSSSIKLKPFADISSDLGLNHFKSEAGGVIVDDFNNDGYLDVVVSSWDLEEPMHFFKNNGDGTFTDCSKQSGLSEIKGGLNIIQADYNNDGLTDILVMRGAWLSNMGQQPKTLLRNNGDGTFTDVTVESGILSYGPTQTATWADFNNDGWLDLFIGNESRGRFAHASELYINNHDGTFTNVAAEAGCEKIMFMKGVVAGDYNKDGWPDIFVSGLDGRKMLLKNKGVKGRIPQFGDVTHEAGLDKEQTRTFPTWFFDYDNDGWPDIFVCGYAFRGPMAATATAEALGMPNPGLSSKMYLYHNNHDGTFTEVTDEMGLNKAVFSMGANFGDLDNDGYPDMYLGTGNPDYSSLVPNKLFKNVDGKRFEDVTSSARVGNLQKGHGVAFADFDNDGNQDIFIETGGAYKGDGYYNSLYLNPGQNDSNNWVSVLLKGTKSNRSAIGAHMAVSFHENGVQRTVYMDVNSGGSFGANPFRKEIGIGKATMIDELTITWPTSGMVQVFRNVAPRQFLTIEEGKDELVKQNIKRLTFKSQPGMGNMGMKMLDCAPASGK